MLERRFVISKRTRSAEEHGDSSRRLSLASGHSESSLKTDVHPLSKGRDFVLEEPSQAAVPRINPAQQLSLEVTERDSVIGLPRAGLPFRLLSRQHDGQAIEVGDHAAVWTLVEGIQAGLVRKKLPDRDALLAVLRELRPVRDHPLVVVEPPQCAMRATRGQALRAE